MYKKWTYKKWTYKKWNYKKWTYKKRMYKKWTYKKRTDPWGSTRRDLRPAVHLEFPVSRCCFPHPGGWFPGRVQLAGGSPWQPAHWWQYWQKVQPQVAGSRECFCHHQAGRHCNAPQQLYTFMLYTFMLYTFKLYTFSSTPSPHHGGSGGLLNHLGRVPGSAECF